MVLNSQTYRNQLHQYLSTEYYPRYRLSEEYCILFLDLNQFQYDQILSNTLEPTAYLHRFCHTPQPNLENAINPHKKLGFSCFFCALSSIHLNND